MRKRAFAEDGGDDRAYIVSLIPQSGAPVVEVGAGDCACLTVALARHGLRVLAVDRDAEATEEASRTVEEEGLTDRIDIVRAEAARLPLRPRSVETVVAYDALHHAADLRAAVRGMAAALHPRGVLIVGDEDEPRNGFLGRLTQALRAAFRKVTTVPRGNTQIYVCRFPQSRNGVTTSSTGKALDGRASLRTSDRGACGHKRLDRTN